MSSDVADDDVSESTTSNDLVCGELIGQFVLPGDLLGCVPTEPPMSLVIGSGVLQTHQYLFATKAGVLRHSRSKKKSTHRYWIESKSRRYVPQLDDVVLGVVVSAGAGEYRVDLGAAATATLDNLAFEGATRKNRPQLGVGSLVYARVTLANKDMEPVISCISATARAEGFGPLDGGYMFKVSLSLARELLHPSCHVLHLLGRHFPYELAVGLNGRVWVKSASVQRTSLLVNVILSSESLSRHQTETLVQQLIANID